MMLNTGPKKFVFVLMPFHADFDDIYKLGIRAACEAAGAYCERVDEQIFHESILERIYNQIAKADLIISDMTGRNPNVFYETGYAHALNKRVILLTQNDQDIPFDLKRYSHIIYGGRISMLRDELERQVIWYLKQPEETILEVESILSYYINDNIVVPGGVIFIEPNNFNSLIGLVSMKMALHNPTKNSLNISNIRFGLILPSNAKIHDDSGIKPPDDTVMYKIGDFGSEIFPNEWRSISWTMQYDNTAPRLVGEIMTRPHS